MIGGEDPTARRMPIEGHLDELRRRLVVSAAIVLPIFAILFVFNREIFNLIMWTGGPYLKTAGLVYLSPSEALFTFIKIAFFLSLVVASPVWLYQTLAFFLPAFQRQTRYVVLRVLPITILLFLAGVAFGVFVLLPIVLRFLMTFGGPSLHADITIGNYASFVLGMTLPPGFLFEIPMVSYALTNMGIISGDVLRKGWRYAILGAAILSATFSPPGPLPMIALGVPILALYQGAIMVSDVTRRRMDRRRAETDEGESA